MWHWQWLLRLRRMAPPSTLISSRLAPNGNVQSAGKCQANVRKVAASDGWVVMSALWSHVPRSLLASAKRWPKSPALAAACLLGKSLTSPCYNWVTVIVLLQTASWHHLSAPSCYHIAGTPSSQSGWWLSQHSTIHNSHRDRIYLFAKLFEKTKKKGSQIICWTRSL